LRSAAADGNLRRDVPVSGRNAFRHGLSLPMEMDPDAAEKVQALVAALAGGSPDTDW
jgi:hypothetical protein